LYFDNNPSLFQLEEAVKEGLSETAKAVPIEGNSAYKNIQATFQCCGVSTVCEGFSLGSEYDGCKCDDTSDENCGTKVPTTCTAKPSTSIYQTPCDEAVYDFIDSNMLLVAGIALAIGLAEILGMVIACCLCNKIKEKGEI